MSFLIEKIRNLCIMRSGWIQILFHAWGNGGSFKIHFFFTWVALFFSFVLLKSHWFRGNMEMKISNKQALPLQSLKIPDSQILLKQCWKKSTRTHVLPGCYMALAISLFFRCGSYWKEKTVTFFFFSFLMTLIPSIKALVSVVGASLLILTCHDTTANWDACCSVGTWQISYQGCRWLLLMVLSSVQRLFWESH